MTSKTPMKLVQKNVKVPSDTWERLKENARTSGFPVCIYLTHLIGHSRPVGMQDLDSQRELHEIQQQREKVTTRQL